MLNRIVSWALRRRGVVIALAFVLLGYGLYSLTKAKYDILPNFAPAQVTIKTEAPGLSAEQVERLVTQPIEKRDQRARRAWQRFNPNPFRDFLD